MKYHPTRKPRKYDGKGRLLAYDKVGEVIDTSEIPEVGKAWFNKAKLVKPSKIRRVISRNRAETFTTGQRVSDKSAPGRLGTIKLAGPEVSEIKWDDGKYQYVINKFLTDATKEIDNGALHRSARSGEGRLPHQARHQGVQRRDQKT